MERIEKLNDNGEGNGVFIDNNIQFKLQLPLKFESKAIHQECEPEKHLDEKLGNCMMVEIWGYC